MQTEMDSDGLGDGVELKLFWGVKLTYFSLKDMRPTDLAAVDEKQWKAVENAFYA